MISHFDPIFTEQFFTAAKTPDATLNFKAVPLPSESYKESGAEVSDFLKTGDGTLFLAYVRDLIKQFSLWCLENNLDLVTERLINVALPGQPELWEKHTFFYPDEFLKYFNPENNYGSVIYPLYAEGIPLLSKIIDFLQDEDIYLQKKINVAKDLLESFLHCSPKIRETIYESYLQFLDNKDVFLMEIKKDVYKSILSRKILPLLTYEDGDEIHVANGILDDLAQSLGIPLSNDGLKKTSTHMLESSLSVIQNDFSLEMFMTTLMAKYEIKIREYKEQMKKICDAREDDALLQIKALNDNFTADLDKFGKDNGWSDFYLGESGEEDNQFETNKNLTQHIAITILKRLQDSGFLHLNPVTLELPKNTSINVFQNCSLEYGFVLQNYFGRLVRKPILDAILEEALLHSGNSIVLENLLKISSFTESMEFANYTLFCAILLQRHLHYYCKHPAMRERFATFCSHSYTVSPRSNFLESILAHVENLMKLFAEFKEIAIPPDIVIYLDKAYGKDIILKILSYLPLEKRYQYILDCGGAVFVLSAERRKLLSRYYQIIKLLPSAEANLLTRSIIEKDRLIFQHFILNKTYNDLMAITQQLDQPDFLLDYVCENMLASVPPSELLSFFELCHKPGSKKISQFLQNMDMSDWLSASQEIWCICQFIKFFEDTFAFYDMILSNLDRNGIPYEDIFHFDRKDEMNLVTAIQSVDIDKRIDLLLRISVWNYNDLSLHNIYKLLVTLPFDQRKAMVHYMNIKPEQYYFKGCIELLSIIPYDAVFVALGKLNLTMEQILEKEGITDFATLKKALNQFNHNRFNVITLLNPGNRFVRNVHDLIFIFRYLEIDERTLFLNYWNVLNLNNMLQNGKELHSVLTWVPHLTQTIFSRFATLPLQELEKYKDVPAYYNAMLIASPNTPSIYSQLNDFMFSKRPRDDNDDSNMHIQKKPMS